MMLDRITDYEIPETDEEWQALRDRLSNIHAAKHHENYKSVIAFGKIATLSFKAGWGARHLFAKREKNERRT